MGSTTYYETTITGRELVSSVRPAKETDAWTTASIEERMQRKFDPTRIRETIVPYLAQHKDRFFGSLIVLVPEGSLTFEPLESILTQGLPAAYRESSRNIGFLTIDKGEMIALDGQHRLIAIRTIVQDGADGEFASVVGDDELCVLFIEFEDAKKTRRIFNKVNRHAKPTGRSDNIVTSEDDGNAIVTRWLLDTDREAPLAERVVNGEQLELVNWTSNTLSQNSQKVTTISAVYETVKDILLSYSFEGFDERRNPVAPPDEVLEQAFEVVKEWWEEILTMDGFVNALDGAEPIPAVRHNPAHQHSLLLRPVGQVALVRGLVLATSRSDSGDGKKLSLAEAVRRANRIDWSTDGNSVWRGSIVSMDGKKMVARREAQDLAAELVAYLIADEYLDATMEDELWRMWNRSRGRDVESDIADIDDDARVPEDLPEPVAR
jgi:DNA sulfur modification protein DndB